MPNTDIIPFPGAVKSALEVAREGIVLLKNTNMLPFKKGTTVSVFGRSQLNYYKSGIGSGGMVNTDYVLNIPESIEKDTDIHLNTELLNIYKKWVKSHPYKKRFGWFTEPWSQKEMPVSDELVKSAAQKTDNAVIIIGRLAGEDKDNFVKRGSYLLTKKEEQLIKTVSENFKKTCVILNTGNIIDTTWAEKYSIDALLYVWQGGIKGAEAVCDILSGRVAPSGKLTDTVAYSISDYPSKFGKLFKSVYTEDIYVGYRYFETFAKEKVMYPFGFGLSYTTFNIKAENTLLNNDILNLIIRVTNTGKAHGKEVVQVYYGAPQGKLGKPSRELAAYKKTKTLAPGESETVVISFNISEMSSYDDSGITGAKSCFVLEEGTYNIYVGSDVRMAEKCFEFDIDKLTVTERLSEAMSPVKKFKRIKPCKNGITYENVPTRTTYTKSPMPTEIPYTGNKNIKLADVYHKRNTLDEFVAQLSVENLACLIRGEGMNSPKVTPGTGAAFGGITPELIGMGIPPVCATDGPSGIRLDNGAKATSIPNGTLIASTFNPDLVCVMFEQLAVELYHYNIDALLAPGMNIHRHPLNGRNFEYFSEDPYVSGIMAAHIAKGLSKYGCTATLKHLCCNNQQPRNGTILFERRCIGKSIA